MMPDKLRHSTSTRAAVPRRRGGRRNDPSAVDARPAQVHPHLHAHRPGPRRGPSRIPDADAPGQDPARRRRPSRKLGTTGTGWIPPVREIYPLRHRQHVLRRPFAHHVGGARRWASPTSTRSWACPCVMCTGEGGCPPRLLRSRFLKYVILQIASRLLRLGRDHPRPARDEGRPLRHRDQVRPGRQARRRRPAHVVQGQQAHRQDPRRARRA
ncbi:MAG: hypothetical protein MZW92_06395 [Comamonadaceae bacterium]|nr:hypothetical protein [Comamonadaceae bacterium]